MQASWSPLSVTNSVLAVQSSTLLHSWFTRNIIFLNHSEDTNQKPCEKFSTQILHSRMISSIRPKFYAQHSQPNISTPTILCGRYISPHFSSYRPCNSPFSKSKNPSAAVFLFPILEFMGSIPDRDSRYTYPFSFLSFLENLGIGPQNLQLSTTVTFPMRNSHLTRTQQFCFFMKTC